MSKNILELCLSPDLGGLELTVLDYFNYFKMQTNVYLCLAPATKLDNYFNGTNKFTLKRNKFFPIIPAIKLAKFIDEKEIDCIHFHWTRDITIVVLAKMLSKNQPKLIQSRHMTMTRFKNDFYHKWLYKNINIIHAVTYQVKEQLERFIPVNIRPRLEMIYLGVNEPKIDNSELKKLKEKYMLGDNFVIGIIGRIEEGKGQYILIEALAKLKNENIKVLIVGEAMDMIYLENLHQRIKELGLEKKVIFTGFTKEVNEHICLCDVTLLATPKETFGLVVIESMVNRVPVIATEQGGPLEIIENGVDGLFFNRTSDDLVGKIKFLTTNKKLLGCFSVNGYKKVKKLFDKEKQMKKMYELICEN